MRVHLVTFVIVVGACGTGDGSSADAFADGDAGTATTEMTTPSTTSGSSDEASASTADPDSSTGQGTTSGSTASTSSTAGEATGSSSGGESSSSSSSETGGGSAGNDYEPCNPDDTCDDPGEVCHMVGAGGFCTTTCTSDDQCPVEPGGQTPAACEFLLGFPDFGADYCGMIGCTFLGNDCPAGMNCTFVVTGLTVCEWL